MVMDIILGLLLLLNIITEFIIVGQYSFLLRLMHLEDNTASLNGLRIPLMLVTGSSSFFHLYSLVSVILVSMFLFSEGYPSETTFILTAGLLIRVFNIISNNTFFSQLKREARKVINGESH
jgi:hypothetical protein